MTNFPIGVYQHFKGAKYLVIGIAKHSENLEDMVVYINLYDNEKSNMWVRPLSMFTELMNVDGKKIPRFKFLGSQ